MTISVLNSYDKVFAEELQAYLKGIEDYPGEIFPELVFRIVRELEEMFVTAVKNNYAFDILEVSKQIARAAKYLVHEKDITFCILSILPPPSKFPEEAQFVLGTVVDQVESTHGGALERLEKKWRFELRFEQQQAA